MILVTGATGNIGSHLVRELHERGVPVRAFVRDPARGAEKLGEAVELAVGDFADEESVQRAVDGVDAVFLASGDGPQKVEHETTVIDASAAAGVARIVKASTMLAEVGSPLPPVDWNGRIEQHLRRSPVQAVVLQSSFYMTNLLLSADSVRQEGRLFAPAGEGRVAMIHPRDVASAGAIVLMDDTHSGQIYELTGPEAITHREVAGALSAATGREIQFVDIPDEAARQALIAAGMPDWLVTHLGQLFRLIRQGALERTTDTVETLTGKPPRTFAEFARDYAGAFGAADVATAR